MGASTGAGAAGAQEVGPSGPEGGAGPRQLQCDQGGQRRAHGERGVLAAHRSHVSAPAVSWGRELGGQWAPRFRYVPVSAAGWVPVLLSPLRPCPTLPRSRDPGRAVWFLAAAPTPRARRTQLRPQKPPPLGLPRLALPPSHP